MFKKILRLSQDDIRQLSGERPLIYTSKGNLPIDVLTLRYERQDEKDQIVLVEIYEYGGEVVRRSPHVLPLAPWQTGAGGRLDQPLFGTAGSVSGESPSTAGGESQ